MKKAVVQPGPMISAGAALSGCMLPIKSSPETLTKAAGIVDTCESRSVSGIREWHPRACEASAQLRISLADRWKTTSNVPKNLKHGRTFRQSSKPDQLDGGRDGTVAQQSGHLILEDGPHFEADCAQRSTGGPQEL